MTSKMTGSTGGEGVQIKFHIFAASLTLSDGKSQVAQGTSICSFPPIWFSFVYVRDVTNPPLIHTLTQSHYSALFCMCLEQTSTVGWPLHVVYFSQMYVLNIANQ